ncbi:Relaxin receptor 2, partial [Varanus komodoensis]
MPSPAAQERVGRSILHAAWPAVSPHSLFLSSRILDNNKLAEILPSVFVGLKSLLFLDLHNNALRGMPNEPVCTEMPQLNWLDLEANQFQTLRRSDFQGCNRITV